jgi:hypothetical protein
MGHHREFNNCAGLQYGSASGTVGSGVNGFVGRARDARYDDPAEPLGRLLLRRDQFQIRLANESWRAKSNLLVERRYSSRGYKRDVLGTPSRRESVTVQACNGDEVFGTVNVGFDSQAGLACDALYKAEIDSFRKDGAMPAEFTRLAVEPESGSKELLGCLFHIASLFAATTGRATDMFIEVNPRHVAFYKRMLNFVPAGECKLCPRVDAPAVLLHLEMDYVRRQIALYGGHRGEVRRSLYSYFCSPEEEATLLRRMRDVQAEETAAAVTTLRHRAFRSDADFRAPRAGQQYL